MTTNPDSARVGAAQVELSNRFHKNLEYTVLLDVVPRKGRPEIALTVKGVLLETGMKTTQKEREAMKVIVANLYAAWTTQGNPFLVIPKRSSDYAPNSRLRALFLTHRPTMKAINALHDAGYIKQYIGYYTNQSKRRTRIRATSKLLALFIKHRFSLRSIEPLAFDFVQLRGPKTKGAKGDTININHGTYAAVARPYKAGVARINSALATAKIELHLDEQTFIDHYIARPSRKKALTPPHPLRNRIYRVFNETFDKGGRFYGHWAQGIPRDLRQFIYINGEPTIELDFKAIHPTLLYAECGKSFEGEVYLPASYPKEYRPVFKLLMLAAINAGDLNGAVMGVRHCIHSHEDFLRDFPECLRDGWLRPAFEVLKNMHKPIGHYFFTGVGQRLQRMDSEIAELVMLTLLTSDVVAVPVHDSFLVAHQHEATLREAMLTCSREVCGVSIPVDKKEPSSTSQKYAFVDEINKTAPVMDKASFSLPSPPPASLTAFPASRNSGAPHPHLAQVSIA